MQPNDLPIVFLPLDLTAAAALVAFSYDLTQTLERHYAGRLLRHAHNRYYRSPHANLLGNPDADRSPRTLRHSPRPIVRIAPT